MSKKNKEISCLDCLIEERIQQWFVFDSFSVQTTANVIKLLEDNHIRMLSYCTDHLQLLDVSVNKAVKNLLCQEFENWYADQVCEQLR